MVPNQSKPKESNKFLQTVRDFGENTSFHSVKYIASKETTVYEKILWTIVALLGISGAVYMTTIFWSRFSSNSIRITTQSIQNQAEIIPFPGIPFPGVTLCSAIRFVPAKIERLLEKLKIINKNEIRNAIPLLMGYVQPITLNETSKKMLELLDDVFRRNGFATVKDIYQQLEPTCDDLLVKCQWEQQILPCNKIFIQSLTKDGHCCSFSARRTDSTNSSSIFFHTLHFGVQYGLTIVLNPLMINATKSISTLNSLGMKVLIHHPNDYPDISSIEKILAVGTESFLRILGTKLISSPDIKSLTMQQRNCLFENDRTLNYFPEYRDTNCASECKILQILQHCQCIPFIYPSHSGASVCSVKNITCLSECYEKNLRNPSEKANETIEPLLLIIDNEESMQCDCPPQCNDVIYNVETSSIPMDRIPYTVSNFYSNNYNDTITDKMILHIYFGNQYQTVLLRDTVTSTYYLLSSFGGVFSLFLGCSLISILEIFYFFCFRIFK